MVIDGETIELPIHLDESQIYDFESGYISALCGAYAEALSKDKVDVDDIPSLPRKYQVNFYDQRTQKVYNGQLVKFMRMERTSLTF